MSKSYTTKSAEETRKIGEELGSILTGGELVLLRGELGGGKTQFTKGIARALGVTETVVSPTFTIERVYQGTRLAIHHFDLYRTHEDREILEQITELTNSKIDITVVEWPENMPALASFNHIEASFKYINDDMDREITITKKGEQWS